MIEEVAKMQLRSWTHASGIALSLLWEGVSRYEKKNRDVIIEAVGTYGSGWFIFADFSVGSRTDVTGELRNMLGDATNKTIDVLNLSPKSDVFDLFLNWASHVAPPEAPKTSSDWHCAGDIAYWIGYCGGSGAMHLALLSYLPGGFNPIVDIEAIASYVSGRFQLGDAAFEDWHRVLLPELKARFLQDTDSDDIVDGDEGVTVYFSLPLSEVGCKDNPKASDWHWQTMKRVRLLQLLFPWLPKFHPPRKIEDFLRENFWGKKLLTGGSIKPLRDAF